MPDSDMVILLGWVGCSADQVTVLRYWAEQHAETEWQDHPVVAIYADPIMSEEPRIYELFGVATGKPAMLFVFRVTGHSVQYSVVMREHPAGYCGRVLFDHESAELVEDCETVVWLSRLQMLFMIIYPCRARMRDSSQCI